MIQRVTSYFMKMPMHFAHSFIRGSVKQLFLNKVVFSQLHTFTPFSSLTLHPYGLLQYTADLLCFLKLQLHSKHPLDGRKHETFLQKCWDQAEGVGGIAVSYPGSLK